MAVVMINSSGGNGSGDDIGSSYDSDSGEDGDSSGGRSNSCSGDGGGGGGGAAPVNVRTRLQHFPETFCVFKGTQFAGGGGVPGVTRCVGGGEVQEMKGGEDGRQVGGDGRGI